LSGSATGGFSRRVQLHGVSYADAGIIIHVQFNVIRALGKEIISTWAIDTYKSAGELYTVQHGSYIIAVTQKGRLREFVEIYGKVIKRWACVITAVILPRTVCFVSVEIPAER
jgi:hypothetical protein